MEQLSKEACLQMAMDEFVMADQVSEIIALKAMDIHSKQTAIAFAKWITDMGINYWDKDKWEALEHNSLSSEQLYELFLQSLK